MKNAWRGWKKISKKIVSIEASIFLGIVFIIFITPLSFILRVVNPAIFLGSSFEKKKHSYWSKMPKESYDLKFARKQ